MKKNNTFGFLPTNLDRSIFQERINRISMLPNWAQIIVLEYEVTWTQAMNNSYGNYADFLNTIVTNYEQKFKVAAWNDTTKDQGPLYYRDFFKFSSMNFTSKIMQIIQSSVYIVNNYDSPFYIPVSSSQTQNGLNNLLSIYCNYPNYSTSVNRVAKVSNTNITRDVFLMLGFSLLGTPYLNQYNQSFQNISHITPRSFFDSLKSAINVIRWLDSENNAMIIQGNVDGVTVDAYEKILSDQLIRLNSMADVVAASNNQLMLDGQAKKDNIQNLINQKKLEIEAKKTSKREAIAKMNDISNNYQSIIDQKKSLVTANLLASLGG